MDARRITGELSVSPQIAAGDVAAAKAAGFRAILCNRPDGEEPGQPAQAEIADAARAAGIAFRYLPVVSGRMTDAVVGDFAAALAELPGPVLAYCRSGTRCTALWSLAEAGQRPAEEILGLARAAGYDMSGIAGHLSAPARPGR